MLLIQTWLHKWGVVETDGKLGIKRSKPQNFNYLDQPLRTFFFTFHTNIPKLVFDFY